MAGETTNSTKRAEKQRERPTIGLALTGTTYAWEQLPWQGAEYAAKERDANLLIFVGGELNAPWFFRVHANAIYALMTSECVDGFVTGGPFSAHVSPEMARDFCERRHLPAVSDEVAIPGFPGVLLDDYQSMRLAVVHLIDAHGCRRIAYAGEPSTTHRGIRERYRAYAETLQAYGLPLDPKLVYPGETADEARLKRWAEEIASDIDALTGQEDALVLTALRTLQSLGVRVPGDVAVVGFNDLMESRVTTPPLTTVRPPFYEMTRRATEILLVQLAGEQVQEQEALAGQLIVRQSCGCPDPAVAQAAVGLVERTGEALEAALAARRGEILAAMAQTVEALPVSADLGWLERLLDAFAAALASESSGMFLRELDDVLRQAMAMGGGDPSMTSEQSIAVLHGALSVLRRTTSPYLDGVALSQAEDLWQQARMVIGQTAARAQAYLALQAEQQVQALREIEVMLITTFDVDGLMDVLAEQLPQLGIPSCYLSLYENPRPYEYPQSTAEWSRLVLAYDEADTTRLGGRVELEPGGQRFRSQELIPEGMWPQRRRYSFMIEPLHFRDHQLGFVLFEVGPQDGKIYETLRRQVSSALRGVLLLQERERAETALEQAYAEVERQVVERTAELKREQEESARLQQEVIEAQQRSIQELSTPIIPVLEGVIVMPLIGSIDTLRARDVTRSLLAGIREHNAKVVILDITGVPIVDSGVAAYLNKTVQAARLKGARTIVTGISEAVAETIVDLGIDWSGIETLRDLRTGLRAAMGQYRGSDGKGERAVEQR
jgi:DNA-binding LacI/PurR family transcriptional regulator/anti-anti-sigma regulatory factor